MSWIRLTANDWSKGSFCCPSRLKIFRSTVIFLNMSFIKLPWQLIKALEVVRNGLPKIARIWPREFIIDSVSRMMKSTGKMNSSTLIKTSLISPLGIFIDLSANWSVTLSVSALLTLVISTPNREASLHLLPNLEKLVWQMFPYYAWDCWAVRIFVLHRDQIGQDLKNVCRKKDFLGDVCCSLLCAKVF